MVGFGSSLRMARRPGWEAAYLDYETLKLLLSQIEATYEEETMHRRQQQHGHHHQHENHEGSLQATNSDYRDELFLESDSDEAYASVDDGVDYDDDYSNSAGSGTDVDHHHGAKPLHRRSGTASSNKPFFLSHSDDHANSSSEDEELKNDGCGAGVSYSLSSWTTWDSKPKDSETEKRTKKRRNLGTSALEEEDAFYMQGSTINTANNAFYFAGDMSNASREGGKHSSLLNAPVMMHASETSSFSRRHPAPTETSSLLLQQPTTPGAPPGSSLYTFSTASDASSTPPRIMYANSNTGDGGGGAAAVAASANSSAWNLHTSSAETGFPMGGGGGLVPEAATPSVHHHQNQQQHQQDKVKRQEERRQRRLRRRRMRAVRRAKEKKVPRHLRIAHSKARAIVERFLGLLRAETEKVLLFAQSRLGELADTAGSLRFPSLDDQDQVVHNMRGNRNASAFHYPISEGGLHPSDSSSDDEDGAPGKGAFPWSDSSHDDENSDGSQRINAPHVFSGLSAEDVAGRGTRSKVTPQTTSKKSIARNDSEVNPLEGNKFGVVRQIMHFTELRQRRPIFLRNDQILGEDMLLISAVEEADGYTAVGVELMHVLRFILLNLMAVKKICKKHDRLLMQRMLGGYYQRTKAHHDSADRYSHIEDAQTLGGLLARVSGDVYDAHPALIGHYSHYKLVGVYDRKIQKVANSRTVQVVSSCLALALSEYEVARSRADALTKLNSPQSPRKTPKRSGAIGHKFNPEQQHLLQPVLSDDEGFEGPPTTESCISLTRLRYTVTSIFALREAARKKVDHFGAYLSRSMLTFTGRPVCGEGLDGCSRETLDFLVAYNPDSALLLDTDTLYRGLYDGKWMTVPMSDVMIRTLATGVGIPNSANKPTFQEEAAVAGAVSVDPESRKIVLKRLLKGQKPRSVVERTSFSIPELPSIAFRLNRISCFLYQLNYFTVHATANSFVRSSGASSGYTSLVIGAPNLAGIMAALIHTMLVSNEYYAHRFPTDSVGLLRALFAFSCFFGIVGNVIHGMAMDVGSVPLAILGRFVFGFSSADILHRQLVAACVPSHVVSQSASLVYSRITGLLSGILLGVIIEVVPFTVESIGIRWMQTSSWFMVTLWLIHFVRILVQFRGRDLKSDSDHADDMKSNQDGDADHIETNYDSDSSDSHRVGSPSFLYQSSSVRSEDPFRKAYGGNPDESGHPEPEEPAQKEPPKQEKRKHGLCRQIRTFTGRTRKFLRHSVAIPLTLFIVLYSNYALELYLSGTSVITCRYFGWSGVKSGLFLGGLGLTILPLHWFCEFIARRYEDRTILKRSVHVVFLGLFCTLNFVSLFSLAKKVPNLLSETAGAATSHPYDWKIGLIQYIVGLPIAFVGLVAMEGSALSILSKLSPPRFRGVAVNAGTIVVFVGFFARLIGNMQLFFVGLSHRLINTDIVNAVAIPLLLAGIPIMLLVKRFFFYLM